MAKKKPYLHAAPYKYHNIIKSRRGDSSISVFCTFPFWPLRGCGAPSEDTSSYTWLHPAVLLAVRGKVTVKVAACYREMEGGGGGNESVWERRKHRGMKGGRERKKRSE